MAAWLPFGADFSTTWQVGGEGEAGASDQRVTPLSGGGWPGRRIGSPRCRRPGRGTGRRWPGGWRLPRVEADVGGLGILQGPPPEGVLDDPRGVVPHPQLQVEYPAPLVPAEEGGIPVRRLVPPLVLDEGVVRPEVHGQGPAAPGALGRRSVGMARSFCWASMAWMASRLSQVSWQQGRSTGRDRSPPGYRTGASCQTPPFGSSGPRWW